MIYIKHTFRICYNVIWHTLTTKTMTTKYVDAKGNPVSTEWTDKDTLIYKKAKEAEKQGKVTYGIIE